MDETKSILWLAIEDYSGLWEAVWQLRTFDPKASEESLVERARTVVERLFDRGLVTLYRCEEPYGQLSEIDRRDAKSVLAAKDSWNEPARDALSFRFGATKAGEEVYRAWLESSN